MIPNLVNLKSEIQKNELAQLIEAAKKTNLFYLDNKGKISYITEKNIIEEAASLGIASWHINKTSGRELKRTYFNILKQVGVQLKLSAFNQSATKGA